MRGGVVVAAAIAVLALLMFPMLAFAASPTPSPSPSPTARPTPMVVADAAVLRDSLLQLAAANVGEEASSGFVGFFPSWRSAYPALEGDGYAIASTPGTVSIWYNYLLPKGAHGAANPDVIAIAVADTAGRCAGGVFYGFPKTDTTAKVTVPAGPCTAQAVVDAFAATFATSTPSPSPNATATRAPAPPATGSGATTTDGLPLFAALGAFVAALGATGLGLSRRLARNP